MSTSGRQLVISVVKGHRRLERVMEGFLELGLPGATVIDAKGMGQIVSTDLPIFSGFRSLFPGSGEESYLIFSVLEEEQVEEAIRMVRDVCRDFTEKGTGIIFTVPVTEFVGPA
jgi:nitrogen regulatory protein PII